MGVPKFFRWLSERYPKINQPIHAPPVEETRDKYFPSTTCTGSTSKKDDDKKSSKGKKNKSGNIHQQDHKVYIQKNSILPEFDRLYLDMNGIIHCCSHNNASDDNATDDPDTHLEPENADIFNGTDDALEQPQPHPQPQPQQDGSVQITEAEIFRNVCYYVDRIVTDIVKPNELVYMAIDGVAPRAKMNQQRSRRYRSGKEKEIEKTFYAAHLLKERKEQEELLMAGRLNQKSETSFMDEFNMEQDFGQVNMDGEYVYSRDTIKPLSTNSSTRTTSKGCDSSRISNSNSTTVSTKGDIQEIEPGRFIGKFETTKSTDSSNQTITQNTSSQTLFDDDYEEFLKALQQDNADNSDNDTSQLTSFHSNQITPGTPFFERCTDHLHHFIQQKLHSDPRWAHLTIIFSGPRMPGEGEHKIMDFIRKQKNRKDYNPNTRHCLFGQDGDLVMLGLATHEPHFSLLREEVVFDMSRKKRNLAMLQAARRKNVEEAAAAAAAKESNDVNDDTGTPSAGESVSISIDSYMHNSNFELLHMSLLRDYLAYEFETNDVLLTSPFELEQTIDDFVFMTFFVGNDFLPHMPAIDIADEAFDLLFHSYKKNRWKWLKDKTKNKEGTKIHPYLTESGEIVSGNRLERFLLYLGKHEDPYYANKQRTADEEIKRVRKADKKFGRDSAVPPDDILAAREEWERTNYKEMLKNITQQPDRPSVNGFTPVASQRAIFKEDDDRNNKKKRENEKQYGFKPDLSEEEELEEGFLSRMGTLFRNSLSSAPEKDNDELSNAQGFASEIDDDFDEHAQDLKGRYYYDKFKYSPLDAEKHIALRKAYIEGLVWNLQYYYKGCVSWDWFYPYHYGPMLSDLKDIDNLLKEITFENENSEPLKPFEQLMACLPPSSADLLPRPYQWLMKSSKSPIIDFYPESFTVDMNGKRWPWEAVVLLPFIDSERLISSSRLFVTDDLLSEGERSRNQVGDDHVYTRDESISEDVLALNDRPNFEAIIGCNVHKENFASSKWRYDINGDKDAIFRPRLLEGTIVPYPGFPTLKDAPIQALTKRKLGINVFGLRSRYRTAVLQMNSDIPMTASASVLASKFIGNTLFFRYPFLQEGFVTAVSDSEMTVRGHNEPRYWSEKEAKTWKLKNERIRQQYKTGEGVTGSGGWDIPESSVSISIRPLKEVRTLKDGKQVKVYARLEVEVPFIAALWSPSKPDSRLASIPALLEKDPYRFSSEPISSSIGASSFESIGMNNKNNRISSKAKNPSINRKMNILPDLKPTPNKKMLLPPLPGVLNRNTGSSNGYCTVALGSHRQDCSLPQNSSKRVLKGSFCRTNHVSVPKIRSRSIVSLACVAAAILSQKVNGKTFDKLPFSCIQNLYTVDLRGGSMHQKKQFFDHEVEDFMEEAVNNDNETPPLEFAHGTTTLSFLFDGGIVAAVDSRASIGSFVGSKTTQKVLPVTDHILGTMAGGAADCSFWIRKLQAEAKHYELLQGKPITVARASRILADYLYANKGFELSVGTMIMGFDEFGPSIYYVDNSGSRIRGDLFAVGSGGSFALGVLDTERRENMIEDEAVALGIKAIRHATFRDAYSGGYIAVYVIKESGWTKVFSEDIALISGESLEHIQK